MDVSFRKFLDDTNNGRQARIADALSSRCCDSHADPPQSRAESIGRRTNYRIGDANPCAGDDLYGIEHKRAIFNGQAQRERRYLLVHHMVAVERQARKDATGRWCRLTESNGRPTAYKAVAPSRPPAHFVSTARSGSYRYHSARGHLVPVWSGGAL
jgi:hypothetical protein